MRSSLDSAATTNSSYSSGSSNSTRSSAIMSPQETTVANQSQMSSRKSGTSFEIYFDDENKKLPARPKSLQKAFETYRNYKLVNINSAFCYDPMNRTLTNAIFT